MVNEGGGYVHRLQRAKRMMARWLCGAMLRSRVTTDESLSQMDVRSEFDVEKRH